MIVDYCAFFRSKRRMANLEAFTELSLTERERERERRIYNSLLSGGPTLLFQPPCGSGDEDNSC